MRVRALLSSSSVGYGLIIGVSRLRMCVQQRRSGLLSAILMACPYRTLPTGRDETEKKGSSASRRRVVWCPGNLRAGNARGLQCLGRALPQVSRKARSSRFSETSKPMKSRHWRGVNTAWPLRARRRRIRCARVPHRATPKVVESQTNPGRGESFSRAIVRLAYDLD